MLININKMDDSQSMLDDIENIFKEYLTKIDTIMEKTQSEFTGFIDDKPKHNSGDGQILREAFFSEISKDHRIESENIVSRARQEAEQLIKGVIENCREEAQAQLFAFRDRPYQALDITAFNGKNRTI